MLTINELIHPMKFASMRHVARGVRVGGDQFRGYPRHRHRRTALTDGEIFTSAGGPGDDCCPCVCLVLGSAALDVVPGPLTLFPGIFKISTFLGRGHPPAWFLGSGIGVRPEVIPRL